MNIAIYPGSFDPITNGHIDIIKRASKMFDKLYVLVSININKKYLFTVDERVALIKKVLSNLNNVEVVASNDLVLDFAKKVNANIIIRGIRNHQDFDNEMELFQFNKVINKDVETIYLFPSLNNLFISSSAIKELINFNGDITPYVPLVIKEAIEKKLKK